MKPSDFPGARKHAHHDVSKNSCLCALPYFYIFFQGNNNKAHEQKIFEDKVDVIAVDEDEVLGSDEEVSVPVLFSYDGGDDSPLDESKPQQ